METLLERLKIKMGLEELTDTIKSQLTEYLTEAETAIKVYLNVDMESDLDSRFVSTLLNLAMLYYKRDNNAKDVKSESYSEGGVSESVTHITTADYETEEDIILQKIARYRKVNVRKKQV